MVTRGRLINKRASMGSRIVALQELIPQLEKLSRKTPAKTLTAELERVRRAKEDLPKAKEELARLQEEIIELSERLMCL